MFTAMYTRLGPSHINTWYWCTYRTIPLEGNRPNLPASEILCITLNSQLVHTTKYTCIIWSRRAVAAEPPCRAGQSLTAQVYRLCLANY